MRLVVLLLLLAPPFLSCNRPTQDALCKRFLTPYPDVVSQRERTPQNSIFLDAMGHYTRKEYSEAIPMLEEAVRQDSRNALARLYLVSALLAENDPYRAEMHLDFLEKDPGKGFRDQVEWYNALCWLCEGNLEKAAQQARYIAARRHTYRSQAGELAKVLSDH